MVKIGIVRIPNGKKFMCRKGIEVRDVGIFKSGLTEESDRKIRVEHLSTRAETAKSRDLE